MQSIGDLIIDKDVNKSEYDIKNNYYMNLPFEAFEKLLLDRKVKYRTNSIGTL